MGLAYGAAYGASTGAADAAIHISGEEIRIDGAALA
jgi:hypothetical protein